MLIDLLPDELGAEADVVSAHGRGEFRIFQFLGYGFGRHPHKSFWTHERHCMHEPAEFVAGKQIAFDFGFGVLARPLRRVGLDRIQNIIPQAEPR